MTGYPDELLQRLLPSVIDRISAYGELASIEATEFRFFIERPAINVEKIVWKDSEKSEAVDHLESVLTLLSNSVFESVDAIKKIIMPYAEQNGKGNVLWPLRMTLSGQEKSVDPFTICYVLGKDEVKERIIETCKKLDS
jgi:glutamyl/glutaminyl-tRNA synthetase